MMPQPGIDKINPKEDRSKQNLLIMTSNVSISCPSGRNNKLCPDMVAKSSFELVQNLDTTESSFELVEKIAQKSTI